MGALAPWGYRNPPGAPSLEPGAAPLSRHRRRRARTEEMSVMTGSNLAAIVIPIVVMFSLGVWIALVFYADSHPRWRQRTAPAPKAAPAAHDSRVPARSLPRPHPAA